MQDVLNRAMSRDYVTYQSLSSAVLPPEVVTMSDEDEIKTYRSGYEPGYGEVIVDLEEDLKDLGVMER